MKTYLYLPFVTIITILIGTEHNYAQSQWIQLNSGTTETINSIDAFDNNRLIAVTYGGTTITSDDYGETWTENYVTYESLTSIDAFGSSAIAVSDYGQILRSSDYGDSWSMEENTGIRLRCAEFYNHDRSFVCGDDEIVLESQDNMNTWNYIPYIVGSGHWLRELVFYDEKNGYVVGDAGTAFKTPNSGYGWFKMDTKTDQNLKSVSFPSVDTGYVCGNGSTILKTTDSGITWNNMVSTNYGDLRGIIFLTNDDGYVCGTDGLILHTNDGGTTWEQEASGVPTHLTDFCYLENIQRLVLIGHDGVVMYKDLVVSSDDIITEKNTDMVTVFPNPANDLLMIDFGEEISESLVVSIFSPAGQKIEQILISDFRMSISLDISHYHPGIYHFTMSNGTSLLHSGSFTKK